VLAAMVAQNRTLQDLGAGFTKYPMKMINVRYTPGTDPTQAPEVQDAVAQVEQALGEKGRVLLRKSGTEPVVRVMVEAEQEKIVIDSAQKIAAVVESMSK
ncbi:MAG TPA: phosphoglucosamine mutase, partial [Pseudoalteromonas sp.]|nr:phosphoglucosamine mutase [Pseudoalteromonas sp.]